MGNRFSAGERQRLALTRALAQDPEVLLLDEAVCHLDPVHASEVQDHIRDQRKCRSCVIVTHDMNAARQAGHIVVLDRGLSAGREITTPCMKPVEHTGGCMTGSRPGIVK